MQNTEFERSPLLKQWDTAELRYSFVWEDFECLRQALDGCHLQPKNILSIGSAGDNAFALLLTKPERMTVVDLSVAQTSLIELKKAAISILPHDQYMALFTGAATVMYRLSTYAQLRPLLGRVARFFWDHNQEFLLQGIDGQGRLDKYFAKFRRQALPLIWRPGDFEAMVHAEDLGSQIRYWNKADHNRLTELAGEFFSAEALSHEGRDRSQFKYVTKTEIGGIFLRNFVRLVQSQLIHENPYLYYFLTGRPLTGKGAHPLWSPDSYTQIQKQLGVMHIMNQDLETLMAKDSEKYDFMNLSDIFEYLSERQTEILTNRIGLHLNPGGVMTYWNLLVDRAAIGPGLQSEAAVAREISRRDRTWFYSGFHVIRRAFF